MTYDAYFARVAQLIDAAAGPAFSDIETRDNRDDIDDGISTSYYCNETPEQAAAHILAEHVPAA